MSYNPVFDDNDVPFMAVKYAADITEQKFGAADYNGQISTIEASRAGDAGRGFGVAATEVKNLANEAKNATDKISAIIESMRGMSTGVVGMLAAIQTAMQDVSEYVTSTAAAVDQLRVASRDISSNMQKAAAEVASLG